MSSLFEITQDMMALLDMMEDPELDPQALQDSFEGLQMEFDDKVESWLKVVKNLEADINERKALMDDLAEKNKRDQRNIDRMKETIKAVMVATGQKKAGTAILSATVCAAGGKMPLVWADGIKEDARLLPEKYQTVETVYKANTDLIREDLDAGVAVPGVEYGERGSYLRIK